MHSKNKNSQDSVSYLGIIAIDGPAGAGKSTVSKIIADRLNVLYVDTGAMYRAVTYKAVKENINLHDEQALIKIAKEAAIQLIPTCNGLKVMLDGADVSKEIRIPAITEQVKYVAMVAGVRNEMGKLQRQLARRANGAVLEGRDIGTVIFPDAEYKFYLDAQVKERANRRFKELKAQCQTVKAEEVALDIQKRDESDINRKVAPLVKAPDAVFIDTTNLSIDAVVDKILNVVNKSKSKK